MHPRVLSCLATILVFQASSLAANPSERLAVWVLIPALPMRVLLKTPWDFDA